MKNLTSVQRRILNETDEDFRRHQRRARIGNDAGDRRKYYQELARHGGDPETNVGSRILYYRTLLENGTINEFDIACAATLMDEAAMEIQRQDGTHDTIELDDITHELVRRDNIDEYRRFFDAINTYYRPDWGLAGWYFSQQLNRLVNAHVNSRNPDDWNWEDGRDRRENIISDTLNTAAMNGGYERVRDTFLTIMLNPVLKRFQRKLDKHGNPI